MCYLRVWLILKTTVSHTNPHIKHDLSAFLILISFTAVHYKDFTGHDSFQRSSPDTLKIGQNVLCGRIFLRFRLRFQSNRLLEVKEQKSQTISSSNRSRSKQEIDPNATKCKETSNHHWRVERVVVISISEEWGQRLARSGPVPIRHTHHRSLVSKGTLKLHGQQAVPVREGRHPVAAARVLICAVLWAHSRAAMETRDGFKPVRASIVLELVECVLQAGYLHISWASVATVKNFTHTGVIVCTTSILSTHLL